jgi:endoglucanase
MEIVDDMGIGWNLGNTFDCFSPNMTFKEPNEQITFWGNIVPAKENIVSIKKYGFKTIRVPITWMHFIDEYGNINSNWMAKIHEVVDWITKEKMYCIINAHHDGFKGNWLSEGMISKEKYRNLWTQIANEFKNYNEYLIFESMNEIEFTKDGSFDYITLCNFNQIFVDTVRNSGGKNGERLLLITGAKNDIDLTYSTEYKLPIDPINKFAVSMCYYLPEQFAIEPDDNYWTWKDNEGNIHYITSMKSWGNENQYKDMFSNFETIKETYIDRGIPVIMVEVGVLTEQQKEIESIRRFLFAEFSMSASYNGIMSCLWDTSKKTAGDMNYYDKEHDLWYDEIIRDNFKKISEGNFVKPSKFFVQTNTETIFTPNPDGNMNIKIGKKSASKVYFSIRLIHEDIKNISFGIESNDRKGNYIKDTISGSEGKKKYDGSYIFTADISKRNFYKYIEIKKPEGNNNITFNYFRIEFSKNYTFFDFDSYIKSFN